MLLTEYVVLEENKQEKNDKRSGPLQPLTVCLPQSTHTSGFSHASC